MIPIISTVVLSALTGAVVYFLTSNKRSNEIESLKKEKEALKVELLSDVEQERLNILGQFSPLLDNISSFTYENGKIEFVDNENNVLIETKNRITKNATNVKSVDGEVYYEKSVFNVSHNNPATKSRSIIVSNNLNNGTDLGQNNPKPIIKNQIEGLDLIEPVVDFTESSNGTVRAYTSVEEWNNEPIPDWTRYKISIWEKPDGCILESQEDITTMFSGQNSPIEYINVDKKSIKDCYIYLKMNENRAKDVIGFSFDKGGEDYFWRTDNSPLVRIGNEHYIRFDVSKKYSIDELLHINFNYGLLTKTKHFVKNQPKIGVFLTEDKILRVLIK